jgi:hypothetical protein
MHHHLGVIWGFLASKQLQQLDLGRLSLCPNIATVLEVYLYLVLVCSYAEN